MMTADGTPTELLSNVTRPMVESALANLGIPLDHVMSVTIQPTTIRVVRKLLNARGRAYLNSAGEVATQTDLINIDQSGM